MREDRLTVNEAISSALSQYLFINDLTRADIGQILGLPGQSVSGRMRGRTKWAAEEIATLAAFFGVTPNDLMPTPDGLGGWVPAQFTPGKAKAPTEVEASAVGTPSGTRTLDPQIKSLLL